MGWTRRAQTINSTRIKYIKVLDKLYRVIKISFFNLSVTAAETDLTLADVEHSEVFDLTELKEFKVTLNNWAGKVIDMVEYVNRRGGGG